MNNTDDQIVALLKERDEALKLAEAWKQQAAENDEAVRRAALEEAAKACYAIGEGGDATADPPAKSGGADG